MRFALSILMFSLSHALFYLFKEAGKKKQSASTDSKDSVCDCGINVTSEQHENTTLSTKTTELHGWYRKDCQVQYAYTKWGDPNTIIRASIITNSKTSYKHNLMYTYLGRLQDFKYSYNSSPEF